MGQQDVVIVGAGAAGLAAAARLRLVGISALVLEREDAVAGAWRRRYDRLRLNTSRWTSTLPGARYPKGTPLFPSRDDMVGYLEDYARRTSPQILFGTRVERIERNDERWTLSTTNGEFIAPQVIVAAGHEHTPSIPQWPGRERYAGRLLHAAEYRNAVEFGGADVLVVGPGCSGMEIAYDLADGGAGRVWVSVRTQPSIILRQLGGMPNDVPARALLRLRPGVADRQARLLQRLSIGDLAQWGLTPPDEGPFTRLVRDAKAPAIVDREVIEAIKARRIEIVPALEALDENGVQLAGQTRLEPSAIITATGYTSGLESMVGHLGVLDRNGFPRVHGGPPAAPGMWFIGYDPKPGQIGDMGREAKCVASAIRHHTQVLA